MDTPNGTLVRRCFRILNAKNIGLSITLADITEEELRVLELIEAERQEQTNSGDGKEQEFPVADQDPARGETSCGNDKGPATLRKML